MPVSGTLLSLCDPASEYASDSVLAELLVDRPALQAAQGLVDEPSYLAAVAAGLPGKFAAGIDHNFDDGHESARPRGVK